ncbi:MAG: hypothetical protein IBX41_05660 [Methanophagales archaeon]|nr:hypothetical protein [Methanophagales archaeon]
MISNLIELVQKRKVYKSPGIKTGMKSEARLLNEAYMLVGTVELLAEKPMQLISEHALMK